LPLAASPEEIPGCRLARTQTSVIGCTGSAESFQPDNEAMRDRHRVRVTVCLFITRRAGDTAEDDAVVLRTR
jgi:hypothetical protein